MKTFIVAMTLLALALPAQAEEKNGLRVDVAKKTVERNDGPPSSYREIGRTIALGVTVKNVGFADKPAGDLEWIVLVERWSLTEVGNVEMTKGTEKLPALVRAQAVDLEMGEIKIGGHLHGTSKQHVDEVAGWKIIIKQDGKTTEFTSSSKFESLYKRALRK